MKKLLLSLLVIFTYNTAIAIVLTLFSGFDYRPGFAEEFVYSQSIGFSVAILGGLVVCRLKPSLKRSILLGVSISIGVLVGVLLATLIVGTHVAEPVRMVGYSWLVGIFFGGIAAMTTILFERVQQLNSAVKQQQLNQMEAEKREMEAQLKMLQAQIEPHFLFNTLANVSYLIDGHPQLAKQLLERLNDWLRIVLQHSRRADSCLGDELEMLDNYLHILKIRFGDRLTWRMEASESARCCTIPPMLLQPLVENSVRHGIEPKLGGGEIVICAVLEGGYLHLSVADNGVGFNAQSMGTGLENVKARLAALYGEQAALRVLSPDGAGVTVEMDLPYVHLSR